MKQINRVAKIISVEDTNKKQDNQIVENISKIEKEKDQSLIYLIIILIIVIIICILLGIIFVPRFIDLFN